MEEMVDVIMPQIRDSGSETCDLQAQNTPTHRPEASRCAQCPWETELVGRAGNCGRGKKDNGREQPMEVDDRLKCMHVLLTIGKTPPACATAISRWRPLHENRSWNLLLNWIQRLLPWPSPGSGGDIDTLAVIMYYLS
jgi:hypothetical protein